MLDLPKSCRARRQRFLERLKPTHPVVLADPLHLRYFANYYVEGISRFVTRTSAAEVLQPGREPLTLYHDNKALPKRRWNWRSPWTSEVSR